MAALPRSNGTLTLVNPKQQPSHGGKAGNSQDVSVPDECLEAGAAVGVHHCLWVARQMQQCLLSRAGRVCAGRSGILFHGGWVCGGIGGGVGRWREGGWEAGRRRRRNVGRIARPAPCPSPW